MRCACYERQKKCVNVTFDSEGETSSVPDGGAKPSALRSERSDQEPEA